MRFVVTGAGGFLGTQLCRYLISSTDHGVVAVSSQGRKAVEPRLLSAAAPRSGRQGQLEFVANSTLLHDGVLESGDVLVNCAFPWNRNGAEMAQGLEFQRDVFRAAAGCDINTFINVSSQSVYPAVRDEPASENSNLELDSPYAVAKYAMELLSAEMLAPDVLVNVRMGSLIGRGFDIRIVNRLVTQALAGAPLAIEQPDRLFSYMDVRDACRALTLIGEQGAKKDASVINVGTEQHISLADIAREAARVGSEASGTTVLVTATDAGDAKRAEVSYELDCTLAANLYGFTAELSLAETVDWIAGIGE